MKVIAKTVFFDDSGLHKKGDIVEVKKFDASRMVELAEEKKVEKKTKKVTK